MKLKQTILLFTASLLGCLSCSSCNFSGTEEETLAKLAEKHDIIAIFNGKTLAGESLSKLDKLVDYEQIQLGVDRTFRVKENEKWGLADISGKTVAPCIYDWIDAFQGKYALVREGNAWGIISSEGKIVLPVEHEDIYPFYPDFHWKDRECYRYESVFYVKDGEKLEVVNLSRRQGERSDAEHIDAPYDYQIKKENGKYGYVNYKGETIPCRYENARDTFSEGLAAVVLNHRIGFINKSGAVEIPFVFEYAEFDFNFYQYGLARFSEGLCAMTKDGKFGYIDKAGETVVPFIYDNARCFRHNRAVVYKNFGSKQKAALIDKKGKLVIPFKYDYIAILPGASPILYVMADNKWGLCSLQGDVLAECIYDNFDSYAEGLVQVKKNGRQGIVDNKGRTVIPCDYEWVDLDWAKEGFFLTKKDGKWGCINAENKVLIPFRYDNISCCKTGNTFVFCVTEAGKRSVITQLP